MEHLIKYRKYLLIFSIFDIKTTEWCQCTALSAPKPFYISHSCRRERVGSAVI